VESGWDLFSLGVGLASLGANIYEGNYGSAALDVVGIAGDFIALAVPGVPGGAGAAIKSTRVAKASVVGRIINKIDFLQNDLNKVHHIMQSKHEWGRLVELTGDQAKDYKNIQRFLQDAIDAGTSQKINQTKTGQSVLKFTRTISDETVEVIAVKTGTNEFKISDAWVKTR
ncbi:MAG: polymorphic toxin type 35 domain-containing protein, partial [Chloroflexota bacterium]